MTFAHAHVRNIAVAENPENLRAFLQPECAAVLWQRQPQRAFQDWIDSLDPSSLPQGRIVLRPSAVASAVATLCDTAGMPRCVERDQLINDIRTLAKVFAELIQTPYLRLRLQAVTTNACRKFHIDSITARLVCTYRGQGTQYGISTDGQDPERVFSVATGAPILLRGTLWPARPASGLLHRSPPIEGSGETRLVLVLDAMSSAEEDE